MIDWTTPTCKIVVKWYKHRVQHFTGFGYGGSGGGGSYGGSYGGGYGGGGGGGSSGGPDWWDS